MSEHTAAPGPYIWTATCNPSNNGHCHIYLLDKDRRKIAAVWGKLNEKPLTADLLSAAPELYEAAACLEEAEHQNANCDECGGEGVPELCPKCFPLFDEARLRRRAALYKARGDQS